MAESKRQKFIRLAEGRTNAVLEKLRILGNCANTSNYEYVDEDIHQIFEAIEQELKQTRARFATGREPSFRLRRAAVGLPPADRRPEPSEPAAQPDETPKGIAS